MQPHGFLYPLIFSIIGGLVVGICLVGPRNRGVPEGNTSGAFYVVLVIKKNVVPLQCKKIARSGAVVARWAHNPKVVGSNPASATKMISLS